MRHFIAVAVFVSVVYTAPQSPQIATLEIQPDYERLEGLMPKFLKEASPDAREQFWDIITDKDATIEQIHSKLQEWATQQGGDVQNDFQNEGAKIREVLNALSDAIQQSSMSTAAKDAFKKLGEISGDLSQTFVQQLQKMVEYMKTVPEETRKEMRQFVAGLLKSALHKIQNN